VATAAGYVDGTDAVLAAEGPRWDPWMARASSRRSTRSPPETRSDVPAGSGRRSSVRVGSADDERRVHPENDPRTYTDERCERGALGSG
jgi:hypothetical protein